MFNTCWRETHREKERERGGRGGRESKGERNQGAGCEVIDERKVGKKRRKKSHVEPLCRCCTAMPLITPGLVCGRHPDQRSCTDNPKRGARSNSANKSR